MVTFKRYAGSLQVEIDSFDDLLAAADIPKTQWVATACPIDGLNCDQRFLRFLDTDGNGRVRVEELLAAIRWTGEMLDARDGIDDQSDTLVLASLSKAASDIRAAAALVLESMDRKDAKKISLEDVRASEKPLRAAYFNGDGIIAPEGIADARTREIAALLSKLVPETKNRSDKPGITKEHIDDIKKRLENARGHAKTKSETFVWGDATESRRDAIRAVRDRVDEYFLQCRLAASRPDATSQFRLDDEAIAESVGNTAALARSLAAAPIAPPSIDGTLEWSKVFRGAAFETLNELRSAVFEPVFQPAARMTEAQWKELSARADALTAWLDKVAADKPVFDHLDELGKITDAEFAALVNLCDDDLARKPTLEAVERLEKLILYQRWLLRFANNFISMPDLYDPARVALFEQGRLVLSGRLFTFSVRVPDRAAHAALVSRGTTFVAYVKVTARDAGDSFEVAVPVTAGTAAGVEVGKRGVFTDTAGKEWDAAVVQIVTNPVSLWEAIIAPYRRIGSFVSSKVESMAGEGDRALEQQLNRAHEGVQQAHADATRDPAAPAPAAAAPAAPSTTPGAGMGGNVAIALSIAISAVSAVIATVVGLFAGKSIFQIIGLLFGLFCVVSVPAGLLAWLKLRKRDMAIVLEACGWALNDRMRLGEYLGPLFTRRPARPRGSRIEVIDSVQETIEKRRAEGLDEIERTGLRPVHWLLIVLGLVMLGAYQFRAPLCRRAAARGWFAASTCESEFFRPRVAPAASAASAPAAASVAAH